MNNDVIICAKNLYKTALYNAMNKYKILDPINKYSHKQLIHMLKTDKTFFKITIEDLTQSRIDTNKKSEDKKNIIKQQMIDWIKTKTVVTGRFPKYTLRWFNDPIPFIQEYDKKELIISQVFDDGSILIDEDIWNIFVSESSGSWTNHNSYISYKN